VTELVRFVPETQKVSDAKTCQLQTQKNIVKYATNLSVVLELITHVRLLLS